MSNNYFQFKQFTIEQSGCAMKVGTDGCLLGGWFDTSCSKRILDIGCGTGKMAQLLASAGYNVSGIDLSEEMLAIAHERLEEKGFDVPLYAMSMVELDGFENVDVAIIPIDSVNYVTEEADVVETFKRIYNSLRQGGQ